MDVTLHSPLAWLLWGAGIVILLVDAAIATLVLVKRRHSRR
jgi:hypothetical protein